MLGASGHAREALGVLDEAQRRFAKLAAVGNKAAAGMESTAITEKGDVLRAVGRLDEAAKAYEESAKLDDARGARRDVAVSLAQLGTVRLLQRRFADALAAYDDTKRTFEALGEPGTVASIWHQIGVVHTEAGNVDAAEHAYRQSLALKVARGDRAGEASTLGQLGALYLNQGRLKEAVSFLRQAADRYHDLGDALHESLAQSNLAVVFHQLGSLDEARDALKTALALKQPYGHAADLWKTHGMLADVERDADHPEAAAEAHRQAIVTYRAYRDDGGEPMDDVTQFITGFGATLRTAGPDAARALLPEAAEVPDWLAPTYRALQTIAAGSRDPALADDPALHPTHAVELALLLAALSPPPT
jgi:tetratricopeptide (TPR) repeat protein